MSQDEIIANVFNDLTAAVVYLDELHANRDQGPEALEDARRGLSKAVAKLRTLQRRAR